MDHVSKRFLTVEDLRLMNRLGVASRLGMQYIQIVSRKCIAGMPSMRKPASNEIISVSVLLWDTAVCFFDTPMQSAKICAIRRYA